MKFLQQAALPVVAVVTFSSQVMANQPEEMIVTAGRVEQSVSSVLAPVTVFNRQRIEAIQAGDVYDILKQAPGIQLARTGGKGGSTGIFVRGTNSGHVLILVDGVRFESATTGIAAIDSLGADQIERIEIVRSPRSSLYGSDAIGGVIQIFTRQGSAISNTKVTVAAGSENTRELSVASNFAYSAGSIMVSATGAQSDGIDSQYEDDDWTGNDNYDLDDDRSEFRDLSLRWSHQLSDSLQLDWNSYYSQDEVHYDETSCAAYDFATWECIEPNLSLPYAETQNAKTAISANADVSDLWRIKLQAGYSLDDSVTRNETAELDTESQIKSERFQYSWINEFRFSQQQQLLLGVDFLDEFVEGDQNYQVDERENLGSFLQYHLASGKASLAIGGRYDDNEQFGGYETGNLAFGWMFSEALEAVLSFGTAFKAPTFNDLYWPTGGNPDLEPEESQNIELQFRGEVVDDHYYEVNLFKNKLDNLIEWAPIDPSDPFSLWQPQNVAEAEIKGVELIYQASFAATNLAFNATYSEPKDLVADEDLRRRSRWVGSVDVSRRFEGLIVGLTLQGASDKKGPEQLAGYGTLDLRIERRFSEAFTAKLKVENLFDKEFIQAERYNDQGRFALLALEYAFTH